MESDSLKYPLPFFVRQGKIGVVDDSAQPVGSYIFNQYELNDAIAIG
jgi:hypothetical protein